MAVTLCVAPPAAGKTQLAVERIRSVLTSTPLALVCAIVPDRLQARAFRNRLALAGGILGAQVVTFEDVYTEILERTRRPVPIANHAILHRLIASILEEMSHAGSLSHFELLVGSASFAKSLGDRFAELMSARVQPSEFVHMTGENDPQTGELARIYQAYQTRLQQTGWAGPEDLGWLAVQALEDNPALLAGWRLVVVDGFDDLNQTRRQVLKLISSQAGEVLVTLPGDLEMKRPVHQRFRRAFEVICAELNPTIYTLPTQSYLPAPLAALECQLLESGEAVQPSTPHVHLLEAQSASEEAREALRWIKAHVQRGNLVFSDCAVFVPEMDTYRESLRAAAQEFGLPVHFTQGILLAKAPAAAALLEMLRLPVLDYPRRITLDCLRSPYFDLAAFGLTQRDESIFEAVSSQAKVVGGKEQWFSALARLAGQEQTSQVNYDDEGGLPQPVVPKGEAAHLLAHSLTALSARLENTGLKSIREWAAWLENLLEELHFAERCEPPVFDALCNALRSQVLGELVAGRKDCDYAAFVGELQNICQVSSYDPEFDWRESGILVGRIMEARGVRFQAVAILGLSEGVFPAVERQDVLLDEGLRQKLGLDPRLGRHQASLFYQAVTRTDRYLLLTRPYLAEGGESWEPSHYWSAVERLFPACRSRIRPDAQRMLLQAASPQEALFWAIRRGVSPRTDPELISRAQQVELGCQVLAARLSKDQENPYEGSAQELLTELSQMYAQEYIWSASRLESYSSCPFRFFVEQVLKLERKERPELGFDSRQLGSMLHAILERAYRAAGDGASGQAVLEILPEIAAEEFRQAPEIYGFRPGPLWEAEKEQLLSKLVKTVEKMAEINQGWTPFAFEVGFGLPDKDGRCRYPPLEIVTALGKVRLHGYIDRLDRSPDGLIRVVDYKTGTSHLSRSDLLAGIRLQLPLYALAAEQACQMGEVVDGFYWSINGAEAGLRLKDFNHDGQAGISAATELAVNHLVSIVSEIRAGAFRPQQPKGGCAGYCAPAAWCWQYEPGFSA